MFRLALVSVGIGDKSENIMGTVERMARAICHQTSIDDGYPDGPVLLESIEAGMWRNHVEAAKAALAAILEPSEMMILTGYNSGARFEIDAPPHANAMSKVRVMWGTMVMAALEEEKRR